MIGIFHGGECLCDSQCTSPIAIGQQSCKSSTAQNIEYFNVTWDEDIVFNLKVSDLPRMARLCVTIVGYSGNLSSKKQSKPISISWANMNFYDYRGILREGSTTLSMWPPEDDDECGDDAQPVFNPLGTVVPNPAIEHCTTLTISFTKYSEGENSIIRYPDIKEIIKNQTNSNNGKMSVSKSTEKSEENEYESTYDLQQKPIKKSPSFSNEIQNTNLEEGDHSSMLLDVDKSEQKRHAYKQFIGILNFEPKNHNYLLFSSSLQQKKSKKSAAAICCIR